LLRGRESPAAGVLFFSFVEYDALDHIDYIPLGEKDVSRIVMHDRTSDSVAVTERISLFSERTAA